ncbi:MAG: secretin N-terminal domain-containing protein [Candidatus Omnitrophota bacterium]
MKPANKHPGIYLPQASMILAFFVLMTFLSSTASAQVIDNSGNLPPVIPEQKPQNEIQVPIEMSGVSEGEKVDLEAVVIDHLEMKDMDIMDALKLLSNKSGLNIIAGKTIRGNVSIYLKNVGLKDALRIILDSNDLAYQEENGIIHVMMASEFEKRYGSVFGGKTQTQVMHLMYARVNDVMNVLKDIKSPVGKIVVDEKSNSIILIDTPERLKIMTDLLVEIDLPVETSVFELNYAVAKDMAEKVERILTGGLGNVTYDERSNKIVVTDTAEKIEEIGDVIEAFDVKEQQVLIEAKIVQIELTDDYELGVDWEAVFAGLDRLDVRSDFAVISSTEWNSKGSVTVGTITNNNYAVMVEALKQIGETNILSSPSIMVLNNQEAKILVGSTEPYVTSTTTTTTSVATTADTVNFIEVGVKLYVTPTIHKDNFITMKVRPEVSSVNDYLEVGTEGNKIPIVKTSEAETSVQIKDGVTIVIGGLIEESKSDVRQKVPVLGDIPIVGAAFRNRNAAKRKTEIAIFLTPKIMSGENTLSQNGRPDE